MKLEEQLVAKLGKPVASASDEELYHALVDTVKEQIRAGKLERYLYYSSLTGIFEAHLLDILGYNFNTELD